MDGRRDSCDTALRAVVSRSCKRSIAISRPLRDGFISETCSGFDESPREHPPSPRVVWQTGQPLLQYHGRSLLDMETDDRGHSTIAGFPRPNGLFYVHIKFQNVQIFRRDRL